MPVRIRIYGKEAIFNQGLWACDDESLEAMLQALADPRAMTAEEEEKYALYCAGRYGGLIYRSHGWEAAPHPEAEIKMEDFQPQKKAPNPNSGGGLFGMFRRKK
ncbi:hypothetical protein Dxin01_01591 [Deinococcus xinjiangensis]|uniref:Uncharacterized protein n=1 Tax=Deinococcus xinjiangensis TaxID=457454 RepID=A0ABP9V999_9DEIO